MQLHAHLLAALEEPLELPLDLLDGLPQVGESMVARLQQLALLGLARREARAPRPQRLLRVAQVADLTGEALGLGDARHPLGGCERQRQLALLRLESLVLLRLLGLTLERAELPLHLVHDVPHAHQVLAGSVELALRLVPLLLVPGDARRLLDEDPTLVGLGGEDVVQLVLVHHRVGARIGAGAGEEVEDVAQARQVAVQEVLALARSIEAAAHGHLGPRHAERAVVREHELDLAEPHGLARRRAVEDQVLHPLAAERLGALLAERPADGFGDVAVVDDDVGRDEIVSLRHGEVVHPGLGRRHTLDRNDLVPVDVRRMGFF